MNTEYTLSEAEQSVLNNARRLLGPNLADYLLSGLGEAEVTHRRAFSASGTSAESEGFSYRFEMVSDSKEGLPIGRDPLVMAALTAMLRERQPMDEKVGFGLDDMLKILQWPQGKESHLMVRRAVQRYASTTFGLIEQPLPEEATGSQFKRLVIGYETISKPPAVKRGARHLIIKVQFWPHFINAFNIYDRKHFLGVEFQTLREIRQIPYSRNEQATSDNIS
jgi:hypothetical protein